VQHDTRRDLSMCRQLQQRTRRRRPPILLSYIPFSAPEQNPRNGRKGKPKGQEKKEGKEDLSIDLHGTTRTHLSISLVCMRVFSYRSIDLESWVFEIEMRGKR
jgi:hypothetical protein